MNRLGKSGKFIAPLARFIASTIVQIAVPDQKSQFTSAIPPSADASAPLAVKAKTEFLVSIDAMII